jgi:hypothetical protein
VGGTTLQQPSAQVEVGMAREEREEGGKVEICLRATMFKDRILSILRAPETRVIS